MDANTITAALTGQFRTVWGRLSPESQATAKRAAQRIAEIQIKRAVGSTVTPEELEAAEVMAANLKSAAAGLTEEQIGGLIERIAGTILRTASAGLA